MSGERRLLISFSGGETSALMAKLVMERVAVDYDEIKCVFANTGQENEETLAFVQRCDEAFGLNVIWIEAETNPLRGVGQQARVVSLESADRNGRVFEAMIAKHGIPNKNFPHCTRELKTRPIQAHMRAIGWTPGSYDTAIGIRVDEFDRMAPDAKKKRIIYPLISPFPHRKIDVNQFWERQPFRLQLKGYEGNCKWCWKKSLRKHLTIITEHPEHYDFPERMEREKAHVGPGQTGEPRVFFREGRTAGALRRLAATTAFIPAVDDARQYQPDLFRPFNEDLDIGGDCSESCEVDFSDTTFMAAAE